MSFQALPLMTQDVPNGQGPRDPAARIAELDAKILTWKRLADDNQIDIAEQIILFNTIKEQKGDFCLSLAERVKRKICDEVIMKVRRNLKPPEGTYKALDEKLLHLMTALFIPLREEARVRKIDVSEEIYILTAAAQDALEQLTGKQLSPAAKEVIKRRQIVLREQACFKFMGKIFTNIISDLAEQAIVRDLPNAERRAIIEGIKRDALSQMPHRGSVFKAHEFCQKLLRVFEDNIELYDQDPEEYHRRADKEWFVVSFNASIDQLKALAKGRPGLIEQIEQLRAAALTRVDREPLKSIKSRVELAFTALQTQYDRSSCAYSERLTH